MQLPGSSSAWCITMYCSTWSSRTAGVISGKGCCCCCRPPASVPARACLVGRRRRSAQQCPRRLRTAALRFSPQIWHALLQRQMYDSTTADCNGVQLYSALIPALLCSCRARPRGIQVIAVPSRRMAAFQATSPCKWPWPVAMVPTAASRRECSSRMFCWHPSTQWKSKRSRLWTCRKPGWLLPPLLRGRRSRVPSGSRCPIGSLALDRPGRAHLRGGPDRAHALVLGGLGLFPSTILSHANHSPAPGIGLMVRLRLP